MVPATLTLPKVGPVRLSRRSFLNFLSALCLGLSLFLFGQSAWIIAKAQVAQVLLERAFAQTIVTGEAVKAWRWADTWPVARIEISRIQASAIVLHGGSGEALAFGPALLNETSRIGERGTAVVSAHRDTHFAFLKDVVVGDRIAITRDDGWCSPPGDRNLSGLGIQASTGASSFNRYSPPATPSTPSRGSATLLRCAEMVN
jgi:sortase